MSEGTLTYITHRCPSVPNLSGDPQRVAWRVVDEHVPTRLPRGVYRFQVMALPGAAGPAQPLEATGDHETIRSNAAAVIAEAMRRFGEVSLLDLQLSRVVPYATAARPF